MGSELTEFLSAQWQDIPLSSVYQSVSFPAPLNPYSISELFINCLMLSIATTRYHSINPALYPLPPPQAPQLLSLHPKSLSLSLSLVVCGSMTYCCAECQAVRLQKPVRTHRLLEVRQGIRADFMSPWHQDDDHGSKCVRAGFSVNVCLCALRGHHWFSPVTLTLQQQTGPSKGQGRVSSSCSSTDTVFRHAIRGHSW